MKLNPPPSPLPFRELFMYSSGYLYNESILERMETHHFKEKSINMTVLSGLHDLHLICHYGQAGKCRLACLSFLVQVK